MPGCHLTTARLQSRSSLKLPEVADNVLCRHAVCDATSVGRRQLMRSFYLSDFKPVIDHPPRGCTIHSVAGLDSHLWPEDGAEEVRNLPATVGACPVGFLCVVPSGWQGRHWVYGGRLGRGKG